MRICWLIINYNHVWWWIEKPFPQQVVDVLERKTFLWFFLCWKSISRMNEWMNSASSRCRISLMWSNLIGSFLVDVAEFEVSLLSSLHFVLSLSFFSYISCRNQGLELWVCWFTTVTELKLNRLMSSRTIRRLFLSLCLGFMSLHFCESGFKKKKRKTVIDLLWAFQANPTLRPQRWFTVTSRTGRVSRRRSEKQRGSDRSVTSSQQPQAFDAEVFGLGWVPGSWKDL